MAKREPVLKWQSFSMVCQGDSAKAGPFTIQPARLERVEVAVRKAKHYLEHRTTCKYLWDGVECDCGYIAASAALDAALSENPDAE